jgi:LysM repeat protein
MMRVSCCLAMLWVMGWTVPEASAASELEKLRARCAEQERQIRRLEAANLKLRSEKSEPSPPVDRSATVSNASAKDKESAAKTSFYTVRAGDNLDGIARRSRCSVEKLAQANGLQLSAIIRPGQKLKLPGTPDSQAPPHAAPVSGTPVAAAAAPDSNKKRRLPADVTAPAPQSASEVPKPVAEATRPASPAAAAPTVDVAAEKPATPEAVPPEQAAASSNTTVESSPPESGPVPTPDKKSHAVIIEDGITYGEFAAKHGTSIKRLNELNGLDLTQATVLLKGSELYVPGQP